MADPSYPNDPFRDDADTRRARELDNRLQVDPELEEGRLGSGRFALYALGIVIVLGAVFYGLNRSSTENAGTAPTQTSQSQSATPGAAPRPNTAPGTTTGTATRPPQSDDAGSYSDRAAKPADNNGAPPPAHDNDQR